MDALARATFLQAQTACALIEAMGMVADNQHRLSLGHSIAYDSEAFSNLIASYGIGHNDALRYLMEGA